MQVEDVAWTCGNPACGKAGQPVPYFNRDPAKGHDLDGWIYAESVERVDLDGGYCSTGDFEEAWCTLGCMVAWAAQQAHLTAKLATMAVVH
jgi:hypothetical protein